MICKIRLIIVFLFVFTMLKTEYLFESNISKPIGANYIQFTVDTDIDSKFLNYLAQNNIEIYREVEGLPYYYTSTRNNNIIYPFDGFLIEDKLLSSDNSGDYLIKFNGSIGYDQMANFLKTNYGLNTVNHNIEVNDKLPVFITRQTLTVIGISLAALIICIYVETSKFRKEILIRKINGYSYRNIIGGLLKTDFKEYIVITLLSLTSYTVYSGYLSCTELLFVLLLILLLISISFSSRIVFIRLTKLPIKGDESKSTIGNIVVTASCTIILIALFTFYTIPVYQGIQANMYQVSNFLKLVDTKSEYQGYYFVQESINSTEGLNNTTFENAMKNGGFTFRVFSLKDGIVQVNKEYITSFFPGLKSYTLIAPESKFDKISEYCKDSEEKLCNNIYYYEGKQSILSYDLMFPGYIDDPIISIGEVTSTDFILPTSGDDILNKIEEGYESDYTVGRQYYDIDDYIQKEVKGITPLVLKNIVIFISFMIVVLLASQLYVEHYLQRNKTDILVKVINGVSGFQIYNRLIYLFMYMLVITLIIIVIISKLFLFGIFPILIVLIIYGLIGIFNCKYINKYIENYYGGR